MRIACLFLVVCVLAACSSSFTPATNRDDSFAQKSALPALSTVEIFARDQRFPNARLGIHSIGVIGIINGTNQKGYIPASCSIVDVGGVAKGCSIIAKQTLHIKKMIAGLFTKADARGCIAAAGRWHGTVPAGHVIPIVFHWTGYCG